MIGFERTAPQAVRHTDGYAVQVGSRDHVEYLDGERVAVVAADLEGPVVRLHTRSVMWIRPVEVDPTEGERALILSRISEGFEAMGDSCEQVTT